VTAITSRLAAIASGPWRRPHDVPVPRPRPVEHLSPDGTAEPDQPAEDGDLLDSLGFAPETDD
jgi:hypothetical protein